MKPILECIRWIDQHFHIYMRESLKNLIVTFYYCSLIFFKWFQNFFFWKY